MTSRFEDIDRGHRIAELRIDGICTHIDLRGEKCPLFNTDIHIILNQARQAIRSARDIHRNESHAKQWTLTTRGGTNRHGLWHCQVIRDWDCPFCHGDMIAGHEDSTRLLAAALAGHDIDPMVSDAIMEGASYDALADL